jgi:hypothetical protein
VLCPNRIVKRFLRRRRRLQKAFLEGRILAREFGLVVGARRTQFLRVVAAFFFRPLGSFFNGFFKAKLKTFF